ncbi:MAG: DUF2232 domain-containing protein [Desulfobacteraceae bacterium]|nr:DUF2232 domain-containing protein [Desulfobacteraceae bacterium]
MVWPAFLLVLASLLLSLWLGPVSQFFVPGLLVGLAWKLDMKYAASMFAGAFFVAILASVELGGPGPQIVLVQLLGLTILFYIAYYKGWSGPKAVLAGLSYLILYAVLMLALSANGDIFSAFQEVERAVAKEFELGFKFYKKSSAASRNPEFDILLAQAKATIIRLLPGLVGLTFLAASLGNVITARVFLRKRLSAADVFGPAFSMWKLPEYIVWPCILAGAVALFAPRVYSMAAENCLLVFGGLYFLQGFSIVEFMFKAFKMPFFVRALVIFLFAIQWYGLLMIVALGLSDIWLDLRSRITSLRDGQV